MGETGLRRGCRGRPDRGAMRDAAGKAFAVARPRLRAERDGGTMGHALAFSSAASGTGLLL